MVRRLPGAGYQRAPKHLCSVGLALFLGVVAKVGSYDGVWLVGPAYASGWRGCRSLGIVNFA
eukprot:14143839-Alexandrium_andersonii.AAC.1